MIIIFDTEIGSIQAAGVRDISLSDVETANEYLKQVMEDKARLLINPKNIPYEAR